MNNDYRKGTIKKVINELSEKYGIRYRMLKPITGGYQNLVFEFAKNNKSYIFRISDSITRSEEDINSELEWCSYLLEQGVPLSRPLKSSTGHLTETVDREGIKMIATLFEKAPGRKISYPEYLDNVEVFKRLGEITGKIHKTSKNYTSPSIKRNNWSENYYLKNFYNYIPKTEIDIRNAYERLMMDLTLLNCNEDSFGLIHGDITVYPFGDDSITERQEMADKFMSYFMSGYYSENNLDDYWIKKIPEFLKLRELIFHVAIYKKWDLNNLSQWQRDYYKQSANRIKNGISLVEYSDNWNK